MGSVKQTELERQDAEPKAACSYCGEEVPTDETDMGAGKCAHCAHLWDKDDLTG